MSTPESVKAQLQELIGMANECTGRDDTDLTTAVQALITGYGSTESGGGETECLHSSTEQQITAAGDGTHIVRNICRDCGAVTAEETAVCADADGDGLCDGCGAQMTGGGEPECEHSNTSVQTTDNGDGTHSVKHICQDCGEVTSEYSEACEDHGADGVCDICGAQVDSGGASGCEHSNLDTQITIGGDGTHTVVQMCKDCGEQVFYNQNEKCFDDDGDGLCDICKEEIGTVWSYAAGTLEGIKSYKLTVGTDSGIKMQSASEGVAVGAANGKDGEMIDSAMSVKIYAIHIPKTATSLALTLNDSYVTGVSLLFFKGTASLTTNSEVVVGTIEDGQVCESFDAGTWDYVGFNFTRDYTSYYDNQSTLVFE